MTRFSYHTSGRDSEGYNVLTRNAGIFLMSIWFGINEYYSGMLTLV